MIKKLSYILNWETFSYSKTCGGGERNEMRRKIPNLQYTRKCEEKEYNDEKCNTEDCPQDANAAKYMSVFKNQILRNIKNVLFIYTI